MADSLSLDFSDPAAPQQPQQPAASPLGMDFSEPQQPTAPLGSVMGALGQGISQMANQALGTAGTFAGAMAAAPAAADFQRRAPDAMEWWRQRAWNDAKSEVEAATAGPEWNSKEGLIARDARITAATADARQQFAKQYPGMPVEPFMQDVYSQLRPSYETAYGDVRENSGSTASQRLMGNESPADTQRLEHAFSVAQWEARKPELVGEYLRALYPNDPPWALSNRPLPSDDELRNWEHLDQVGSGITPNSSNFASAFVEKGLQGLRETASGLVGLTARLVAPQFGGAGFARKLNQGTNIIGRGLDAGTANNPTTAYLGKLAGDIAPFFGGAPGAAASLAGGLGNRISEGEQAGLSGWKLLTYAGVDTAVNAALVFGGGKLGGGNAIGKIMDAGGGEDMREGLLSAFKEAPATLARTFGEMSAAAVAQQLNKQLAGVDPTALTAEKLRDAVVEAGKSALALTAFSHIVEHGSEYPLAARQAFEDWRNGPGAKPYRELPADHPLKAAAELQPGADNSFAFRRPRLDNLPGKMGGPWTTEAEVKEALSQRRPDEAPQDAIRRVTYGAGPRPFPQRLPGESVSDALRRIQGTPTMKDDSTAVRVERPESLSDPQHVRDWVEKFPNAARQLAEKDSITRSDLKSFADWYAPNKSVDRAKFLDLVKQSVDQAASTPRASETTASITHGPTETGGQVPPVRPAQKIPEELDRALANAPQGLRDLLDVRGVHTAEINNPAVEGGLYDPRSKRVAIDPAEDDREGTLIHEAMHNVAEKLTDPEFSKQYVEARYPGRDDLLARISDEQSRGAHAGVRGIGGPTNFVEEKLVDDLAAYSQGKRLPPRVEEVLKARFEPKRKPVDERVADAADAHGLDPQTLREHLSDVWEREGKPLADEIAQRERLKAEAREAAGGIKADDIHRLENRGYDYSGRQMGREHRQANERVPIGERSARRKDARDVKLVEQFPRVARELAENHPELGVSTASGLWSLLKEEKQPVPDKHDPEWIDRAAQQAKDYATYQSPKGEANESGVGAGVSSFGFGGSGGSAFGLQQESANRPAAERFGNGDNNRQDALFPKGGLPGQQDFLDQMGGGSGMRDAGSALEERGNLLLMASMTDAQQAEQISRALKMKGLKPTSQPLVDAMRARGPKQINRAFDDLDAATVGRFDRDIHEGYYAQSRAAEIGAYETLEPMVRAIRRMPVEQQAELAQRYYESKPLLGADGQPDSRLNAFADRLRGLMKGIAARVNAVNPEKLQQPIENYIKGLYRNQEGSLAFILKQSTEGPKGFLNSKTFASPEEAAKAGYKPVTNFVEANLLAYGEQLQYIRGWGSFSAQKELGGARWAPNGAELPEGWVRMTAKMGRPLSPNRVELREGFDKLKRQKIEALADKLGIPRETTMKMTATPGSYNLETGKITTRFGSGDRPIGHELGHGIDQKYPDFAPSMGADHWRSGSKVAEEIKALAASRYEGQDVSKSYKRYAQSKLERLGLLTDAYLHAPELFKERAPTLFGLYDAWLDKHPELADMREIKNSLVFGERTATMELPGLVQFGSWIIPRQYNHYLENFASKSLGATLRQYGTGGQALGAVTDAYRAANNAALGARLFGWFHLKEAALIAMGTKGGLGVMQLERGLRTGSGEALRQGGLNLLKGIIPGLGSGEQIYKGRQIEREMIQPGTSNDPEIQQAAKMLLERGEMPGRSPTATAKFALRRAWDDFEASGTIGSIPAGAKVGYKMLQAAMEKLMAPAMATARYARHSAVYERQVEAAKRLAPPDDPTNANYPNPKSLWDVRRAQHNITGMGEEVFGQVEYPRYDVPKATIQSLQMMIQSLGWTGGTLKFGGHVVLDTAGAPIRAVRGQYIFTDRMATAAGGFLSMAAVHSMYQLWKTGKLPQSPLDLVYPQNGETNPDGTPGRANVFSYGKEYYNWRQHPLDTAISKLAPALQFLAEIWRNEDRYGTQVYRPGHEASDIAQHAAAQFVPFMGRNISRRLASGGSASSVVESALGVNPAPSDVTRTPAMRAAIGYLGPRYMTVEQAQKAGAKRDLVTKSTQQGGLNELKDQLDAKVEAGDMTRRDANATLKKAGQQPLLRSLHAVTDWNQRLDVFGKAVKDNRPEENTPELHEFMQNALAQHLSRSALNDVPQILDSAKQAGLDTDAARSKYALTLLHTASASPPKRMIGEKLEKYQPRAAAHQQRIGDAQRALNALGVTAPEAAKLLKDEAVARQRPISPIRGARAAALQLQPAG